MSVPDKAPLVQLDLTKVDGNAFAILAAFSKQALKQGWTQQQVREVVDQARSKDYVHLVSTICDHLVDS